MTAASDPAPLTLDRESFAHMVANPQLCDPSQIRAAVDRADYDDAAIRALAAAELGVAIPVELVADVLIGVVRIEVFLPLARHTTGEQLLDLLGRGRFADEPTGRDQTSYAMFALSQQQPPEVVRGALLPRLRRLARCAGMPPVTRGMVAWLVARIDDPHLRAIYEKHQGVISEQHVTLFGRIMQEFWQMPIEAIASLLPGRQADPARRGVPVRAAPKPGRNEPCPCGSGKKLKKCHGEIPPPEAPRLTRSERLRAIEPQLDREQICQLSRAELAELDVTRLLGGTLVELVQRQARLRDWRRASLAHAEYVRRVATGWAADELWGQVIFQALLAGQLDVAAEMMAQLGDPAAAPLLRLELAIARGESGVPDLLERVARVAVQRSDVSELAAALVRRSPALGILVARGALATNSVWEGESLLDWIEEARDDLELPPGDPAQRVFDALGGQRKAKADTELAEAERARLNQTAADLQAHLDDVTSRLKAMEQQASVRERELEHALRAAAEPQPRVSQEHTDAAQRELRAQRQKIDELQAGIRERNEERAALRRQLAELIETQQRSQAQPPAPPRGGEAEENDEEDDLPEGTVHPVRLLRFRTAAEAAFESVPREVAATAMRTIGALAAGDAGAWRNVKQAKDMPRQVIIARVGIHYRLLLRTDEGPLEVLELVTRQNQDVTLKRLRS